MPSFAGERSRNAFASPFIMYSISNNSKSKAEAWDFISFLLNDSTQGQHNLDSTSVNLKTIKNIYKSFQISNELEKQFDELFDRVDFLYDTSDYRNDIISPLLDYIDGKTTLDEALEKAEYNVWLRLNE